MLKFLSHLPEPEPKGIKRYLIAVALISFALLIRLVIWPIDYGLQYVTFFPAVALTAVLAGFGPGMFTTMMGIILATTIFTPPYMTFSLEVVKNSIWSNVVFAIDGLIVCFSIEQMHRFRRKYVKELEDSRQSHHRTQRSRQQFMQILNNVLDGIITINADGNIMSFNKAASVIFGYARSEVIGRNISMLISGCDDYVNSDYFRDCLITLENRSADQCREIVGLRKDGSSFSLEMAFCEVDGREHMYCGVVRDVSERKAREEQMIHLAHHDHLTNLPNRMLMVDRLRQLLAKARRNGEKLSVMFIDLDGFKDINDTLGHDVGDLLLKAVTTRILDCLRESDTAARMGGDEFVVLLPTVATQKSAMLVADKILSSINDPYIIRGQTISISSSIGVVLFPEHGSNEEELINGADKAMYCAKRRGKNQAVFYSRETA